MELLLTASYWSVTRGSMGRDKASLFTFSVGSRGLCKKRETAAQANHF